MEVWALELRPISLFLDFATTHQPTNRPTDQPTGWFRHMVCFKLKVPDILDLGKMREECSCLARDIRLLFLCNYLVVSQALIAGGGGGGRRKLAKTVQDIGVYTFYSIIPVTAF